MAKCVKHAFKTYPKLRLGRGSALESEIIEQPTETTIDPYGGVGEGMTATAPQQEQDFAPAQDMTAGVQIQDNSDDTF